MKVGLIINTYRAADKLECILKALLKQTYGDFEVIVAEDDQSEATAKVIAAFMNNPVFCLKHVSQENRGFRRTAILNKALRASVSEYIIFLDGDCIPHRRFIEDHIALAERGFFVQGRRAFVRERAVAVTVKYGLNIWSLILKGCLERPFKAFRHPFKKIKINKELHGILGCNFAAWMDDIKAINGYNEAFEGWGREDSEFAARLYHLGLKRKLVYGRAIVFHLNHPELPRTMLEKNQKILEATLAEKKVRCEKGLTKEAL